MLSEVITMLKKDLLIEFRSRVILTEILPIGVVLLLLFGLLIGPDKIRSTSLTPGIIWAASFITNTLIAERLTQIEISQNQVNLINEFGLNPMSAFFGKMLACLAFLLPIEIILFLVGIGLMSEVIDLTIANILYFALAVIITPIAVSSLGLMFGALSARVKNRVSLLNLLIIPTATPVLLAATIISSPAIGLKEGNVSVWVLVTIFLGVVFFLIGSFSYGACIEE